MDVVISVDRPVGNYARVGGEGATSPASDIEVVEPVYVHRGKGERGWAVNGD